MLIEIAAADLLRQTPRDVVRDVLRQCLGSPPSEDFLDHHAAAINDDEIGFLDRYLSQWPGAFQNSIRTQQKGIDAMQALDDVVSVGFLMSVPSELFLDVAYRDFFGRALDQAGREAYGAYDFDLPSSREAVILALSTSNEYVESSGAKTIAGPEELIDRLGQNQTQALYWDRRIAIDENWYAPGPIQKIWSGNYMPFVLWMPQRGQLYSLPGMALNGELNGNLLRAKPEWAMWGPKASLPAGHYRLKVDIEGEPTDLLILDVCSAAGTKVHTKIEYFGTINLNIPLVFDDSEELIEVRLFNYTGRIIELKLNEISLAA